MVWASACCTSWKLCLVCFTSLCSHFVSQIRVLSAGCRSCFLSVSHTPDAAVVLSQPQPPETHEPASHCVCQATAWHNISVLVASCRMNWGQSLCQYWDPSTGHQSIYLPTCLIRPAAVALCCTVCCAELRITCDSMKTELGCDPVSLLRSLRGYQDTAAGSVLNHGPTWWPQQPAGCRDTKWAWRWRPRLSECLCLMSADYRRSCSCSYFIQLQINPWLGRVSSDRMLSCVCVCWSDDIH